MIRASLTPSGPSTIRILRSGADLEATAWGPGAATTIDQLMDLLGARDDLRGFTPAHPLVRRLHRDNPGLRMCRTNSVLPTLIPTVLEQKVTSEEAHRSYALLVRRFGSPAPGPGTLLCPPHPGDLARLPYHGYHVLGIERRRADLIREVCRRADAIERLTAAPSETADQVLRSIDGIGPWTSACVRQVAFGDPDAVIVGDYHLPNIVSFAIAGEQRATDERMLELLEPFRGHRARVVRLLSRSGIRPQAFGPKRRVRTIASI